MYGSFQKDEFFFKVNWNLCIPRCENIWTLHQLVLVCCAFRQCLWIICFWTAACIVPCTSAHAPSHIDFKYTIVECRLLILMIWSRL